MSRTCFPLCQFSQLGKHCSQSKKRARTLKPYFNHVPMIMRLTVHYKTWILHCKIKWKSRKFYSANREVSRTKTYIIEWENCRYIWLWHIILLLYCTMRFVIKTFERMKSKTICVCFNCHWFCCCRCSLQFIHFFFVSTLHSFLFSTLPSFVFIWSLVLLSGKDFSLNLLLRYRLWFVFQ